MKKTVRLLSIMAVIVAGCTTACGQNAIKNTADDSGKQPRKKKHPSI